MAEQKYTAGDLEVVINGISDKALSSISAVTRSLKSLQSSLLAINNLPTMTIGTKLKVLFNDIDSAINSVGADSVKAFGSLSRSISSITGLSKLEKMDWGKVASGFDSLTTSITPFINKVKEAETSLTAMYGILQKTSKSNFANLTGGGSKSSKFAIRGFNFAMIARAISSVVNVARRLGQVGAELLQYGVDYTETLNLWQVAMRENIDLAEQFVEKMNRAYGISQKTVMQAQATFKNMIGSLGDLSESTAYTLSEAITQMAIDYASLYNVTIDNAINKFQSALAGQVRPVRSISGYDITEKTIQALYESLGGTKTQRQLSRTEKQLLAIYAIFNQMSESGALGDMTKTLDQFANQARMMNENWQELATWLGVILQYLLQESEIMVKINALLITAREAVKNMAFSLGYETPDFAVDWAENVEDTSKAVDDLQGKLLGFDEFRALSSTEEETLDIDESLLQAMSGYSSFIDQAQNSAQELAESWMEATYWQRDANGELVFSAEKAEGLITLFQELFQTIKDLEPLMSELFENIVSSGLLSKILQSGTKFTQFVVKLLDTLLPIVVLLMDNLILPLITENIQVLYDTIDGIAIILNMIMPLIEALAPLLQIFSLIMKLLSAVGQIINNIIRVIANFVSPAFEAIGKVISGIIKAIQTLIKALKGFYQDGPEGWLNAWDKFGEERKKSWLNWNTASIQDHTWANNLIDTINKLFGSNIKKFANGGLPDKGTVFLAGEAGAEIVYDTPSGQSGVVNVQQIKSAFYQALVEYGNSHSQNQPIVVYLDGEVVYENTTAHAKRRGNGWANA